MKSRIFPFYVRANASTRSSVVTPLLNGPAIITRCHFSLSPTTGVPFGGCLELSLRGNEETNVPINNVEQQSIPLFEPLYDPGVPVQGPFVTQRGIFNQGSDLAREVRLKLPIFLFDPFNVMISLLNGDAFNPKHMHGYLRIWESVPLDMLEIWID